MASVPVVALDARLTRQMSAGMKTYAVQLAELLPIAAPDLQFVAFTRGGNFGWEEQVRLPLRIRAARANLTHYLSLYAPLLAPQPFVVTVHDLIHLRFPKYFKAKIRPYYLTAVRCLCARAARVITDDERTVGDLERFLGVDPSKVRVIPLGAANRYFSPVQPHLAQRPYLLYAGNHRAHKDLPTLLRAWASLPSALAIDLYLTGSSVPEAGAQYSRENGAIVMLGEVSEADLASYYAGAAALVHPALCEGFGLPMLEAMACGCPVVACEDALPTALRPAALTFPARDASAARDALVRLLGDRALRARLADAGQAQAAPLTWERCARETAQVYRDVLMEERA